MYIKTDNIIIRAFSKEDAQNLYTIAREANIYRFMPDWAEGFTTKEDYYKMIEWFQAQQDNTDLSIGRRYAVALAGTNQMIGMVGVGLEETLN